MSQLSYNKVEINDEQNFKKNFIWNMLGMTFNSFNSLFNVTTDIGSINSVFPEAD